MRVISLYISHSLCPLSWGAGQTFDIRLGAKRGQGPRIRAAEDVTHTTQSYYECELWAMKSSLPNLTSGHSES